MSKYMENDIFPEKKVKRKIRGKSNHQINTRTCYESG